MGVYEIVGGRPLSGTVSIHGAKNSVLPILAATLVTRGRCRIENCPNISDVETAIAILRCLGCEIRHSGDCVEVDTYGASEWEIPPRLMEKMRAAVIFLGALLTRFGKAKLCHPGGCPLGERPIDLHLRGLRHMGVSCGQEGTALCCETEKMRGCTIALPFPSVGATENLLLAALSARGEVVLCNCAKEPEIEDLIAFLRSCGAEISGDGTSVLRIQGGKELHGANYRVMPDRMEAATYLAAAAATRGEVRLTHVCPRHFASVTEVLRQGGCEIETGEREVFLHCRNLRAVSPIRTAPYDGFPTDAQAPVMAAMATAEGVTVFEENIFEHRFCHVPALRAMGADIYAAGPYAVVRGVKELSGARVEATDLRGGAAMVIAALSASGKSYVYRTEHMQRGYEGFVETLKACGAEITTEGQ